MAFKAPYGYINDPKLRNISIDPEESKVVKKAFKLFLEDKTFTEISKYMCGFGMAKKMGSL